MNPIWKYGLWTAVLMIATIWFRVEILQVWGFWQ